MDRSPIGGPILSGVALRCVNWITYKFWPCAYLLLPSNSRFSTMDMAIKQKPAGWRSSTEEGLRYNFLLFQGEHDRDGIRVGGSQGLINLINSTSLETNSGDWLEPLNVNAHPATSMSYKPPQDPKRYRLQKSRTPSGTTMPNYTSSLLDSSISVTEIESVIKDLHQGKSPGPDGFTNAYYCKFSSLLSCAHILMPLHQELPFRKRHC